MSTISASTTSTTGFKVTSDTTGTLVFQTGASPTTAMSISSAQIISFTNPPTATGGGSVATNTAYGTGALASNTTGDSSTAIGYQALNSNVTNTNGTAVGYQALRLSTAENNTAIGKSAASSNTSGANIVAVGMNALFSNNTGDSNTAVGFGAGYSNTSAVNGTFVGYQAGYYNTAQRQTFLGYQAGRGTSGSATGTENVAVGRLALFNFSSGASNVAVGHEALYTNATGSFNTAVGYQAGYYTTGTLNAFYGNGSGANATGSYNSFFGEQSGYSITSGTKNTIIGRYSGNTAALDIRTASNYIVLSDGDGNPRFIVSDTGAFGNGTYGIPSSAYVYNCKSTGASGGFNWYIGVDQALRMYSASGSINNSFSSAASLMGVAKDTSTSRSINCAGTVNQNGADYAEYMVKSGDFTVAKGDMVGINSEGKLTNVFADAISFCVKSTDPGLVGGDSWFNEQLPVDETGTPKQAGDAEYDAWFARMEAARSTVDRIAFCGQVPVNVTGATAGQYIIPVDDNGAIKGEAISNPTFEQYQQAVGKVIAIEQDGRARIIVKVA